MKGSRGASLPGVGLATGRPPVGPLGMGAGAVGVRGKGWGAKMELPKSQRCFSRGDRGPT